MIDYKRVQMLFVMSGHVWRIDGEVRIPEPDEIEKVIDRAKSALIDYEPGAQLEVGHLIIKKRDEELYDVFFHIGEERR